MTLRILATGGTFDKQYDPIAGELTFADSHLPGILTTARVDCALSIVMQIDSLDMTNDHRSHVLRACRNSAEQHIVIIHGTDTMVETASVLAQANLAKTIVITGAMVPASVHGSDSSFNLGFAMASAQTLPHGVWVAMNAVARPWNDVTKNRQIGRFEAKSNPRN